MNSCELSFILCCFNEFERLPKAVPILIKCAEDHKLDYEILIIDNSSKDGTRDWIEKYSHPKVKKIFNSKNIGKGGSIQKGLLEARGKYAVIFDPDLEYLPIDAINAYAEAKGSKVQLVLGSRLLEGNAKYVYAVNYLGVKCLTSCINILFRSKLTDTATATKVVEREFVNKIRFESQGFNFDFELVTRVLRLGGKVKEVPAQYFPRSIQEGKKIRAFRDGSASFLTIIRDRFILRRNLLKRPQNSVNLPLGINGEKLNG